MGHLRLPLVMLLSVLITQLVGCGGGGNVSGDGGGGYLAGDRPPDGDVDVSNIPDAVPRPEPRSRYGNPESYKVMGQRYYVMESSHGYVERGIASWYGKKFHGRLTSNREPYDMLAMTAAHKSLPLPTYVRVTSLDNGRSVVVRVNDRGPFHDGRIIDLSYAAAMKLGIAQKGTGHVEVRALDPGMPETRVAATPAAPMAASPERSNPNQRALAQPAPESRDEPTDEPTAQTVDRSASTLTQEEQTAEEPGTSVGGDVYLQLGAFSSQANAEKLVGQLRAAKFENAQVVPGAGATGPIYRVRMGPYGAVRDADRLTVQINALGLGNPHVVID
ncbi:MAG: septal ring lytic transglycosylase RlpA family protein [Gammaproteobacteria bacterium]|nr:septal ring lytic transglycosylase RlpA family protein [Gammaproteobacteria bacterium]